MWNKLAILGLAIGAARGAGAHEPTLSRFNYGEHVRPLFVRHCGGCHRGGGIAPMSLLDYQDAVPWANAIKLSVLEGRMPPFLPGDDGGPFQGARALTALEIDTIVDWTVGTTPEGTSLARGEDAPPATHADADILLPAGGVVLDESESEKTACILLPTELPSTRLVSGLEVIPGEPSILRRAAIFVGSSCSGTSPLAVWLPDRNRVSLPDGLGWKLAESSSVALELHYVKGWGDEGKRIVDRSALGLWFAREADPVRSVPVENELDFPRASRLVALYAAPVEDAPLRVESIAPDGSSRVLLSIERLDPAWSEKYFFESPVLLPAGSRLRASQSGVWADIAPLPSASQ